MEYGKLYGNLQYLSPHLSDMQRNQECVIPVSKPIETSYCKWYPFIIIDLKEKLVLAALARGL